MKTSIYRYLWLGNLLSTYTEIFYLFAVITIVYRKTESAWQLAIITFLIIIGKFIGNTLNSIMFKMKASVLQFVKTILLLILVFYDSYQSVSLFFIQFVTLLVLVLNGLLQQHSNILHSFISNREDSMESAGFLSYLDQAILLSGWFIAGMLFEKINSEGILIVTCILSLICLIIFFSVPQRKKSIYQKSFMDRMIGVKKYFHLTKFHFIYVLETIIKIVWIASILYLFVHLELKKGEFWWGIVNAVFFIGMVLAHFIQKKFHSTLVKFQYQMIFIFCSVISIVLLLLAINRSLIIVLFLFLVASFCNQLKENLVYSAFIEKINPNKLTSILDSQGTTMTILMAISVLVTGYIVEQFGVQLVYFIACVFSFITIPIYYFGKIIK
ncbi:hypothetical protein ACQKP0_10905 [Heyndrickxia sp. NPDC080065]|uniref:hypothetical protein n=1 Tax=Heyndrickxia sp. NPDC080065 TaxID=3390568 RepID=UPI003CFC601B